MTPESMGARLLGPGIAVVVGAALAWVVGAAPWWRRGLQLPISSAWPDVTPDEVIRVALPFGEHQLTLLIAVTWVGAAVALLPAIFTPLPRFALSLGAAAGQGVALLQTLQAIRFHTADTTEARLLIATSCVAAVTGMGAGIASGWALTASNAVPRGLAGAALAALTTTWLGALIVGHTLATSALSAWWSRHGWLATAVLLGLALSTLGWRPVSRLPWWPVCAGVTALLVAVSTAVQYAGSYARAGSAQGGASELVDATRDVFWLALAPDLHEARLYATAVLIGAVSVAGARLLRVHQLQSQSQRDA